MRFHVGTSGFSYKEWRGSFYPEKFPEEEMLSFYANRFTTVEINNTFYRMPSESLLESWAAQVPASFRFVLKAPKLITHHKRLKDVAEPTDDFIRHASVLRQQLGALLFQLPPNFKKDLPRLEAFIDLIGGRAKCAFEFRHESWFDDEVFDLLRAHACTLCVADVDDGPTPNLVSTAAWGYARLRREAYSDNELREWIARIKSQLWNDVYVFFKHEDTATGPKLAARCIELAQE
jgi:uncharacterized protein YecE (DUF72 family)